MDLPDYVEDEIDGAFTGSIDHYGDHEPALVGSEYDETDTIRDPNYYWIKVREIS